MVLLNMQGYRCMMMHDVTMTRKEKKTISNRGFFRVVTIDTTNKGSRPEIHDKTGEELGKLSDLHA
jgi:hypothetical protein